MERATQYKVYDLISRKLLDAIVISRDGTVIAFQNGEQRLVKPHDAILCQWTGCNEIYEMAIVERLCLSPHCDLQHKGIVFFNHEIGMYVIRDLINKMEFPMIYRMEDKTIVPTVVGHLFENPEMLKSLGISLDNVGAKDLLNNFSKMYE